MSTTTVDDRVTSYNPVTPTTMFAADFPVFDRDDLAVLVNDVEREDFTVVASFVDGVSSDATIVFPSGVTGAVKVFGARAARRVSSFTNGAPLPIKDVNLALDILTAQSQESGREASRTHKAPLGEQGGVFSAADVGNAQSYAESALADRLLAQKWAENNRDVAVVPGKFSAKHWAEVALESVLTGVAGVSSFNGRIGAVEPSSSDYISTQIGHGASNVGETLDELATNVAIADQATAQAGIDNTKRMTPLRTRQAAAAFNRWETIRDLDLAGVSAVNVPDLSEFRTLKITGNAKPSINGASMLLQASSDNGSTWLSGIYLDQYVRSVGDTVSGFLSGALAAIVLINDISSTAEGCFEQTLTQFNKSSTKFRGGWATYIASAGAQVGGSYFGRVGTGTPGAWNALRVYLSSGAFSTGYLHIEGIRG